MASALARHPAVMTLDRARVRSAVRRAPARPAADPQHRHRHRGRAQRHRHSRARQLAGADGDAALCRGGRGDRQSRWSASSPWGRFPGSRRSCLPIRSARRPTDGGWRAGAGPQPGGAADVVSGHPAARRVGRHADRCGGPRARAQPRRRALHRQTAPSRDRCLPATSAHAGPRPGSTASSASTATRSSTAARGC